MFKIKDKGVWVILTLTALVYPLSVLASTNNTQPTTELVIPFTVSYIGIWVFSGAGGLCAGFVKIGDIDNRLHIPILAKFVIGTSSGVAIALLIDAFTSTPHSALTFFALFASLFSSPIISGLLVYLSNQKRLNSAFDQMAKMKGGIDLTSVGDDYSNPNAPSNHNNHNNHNKRNSEGVHNDTDSI